MDGGYEIAKSLLGPFGGQLALAFGAGCTAGYAFCIRTVYKMLGKHSEDQHAECVKSIETLRERVSILEDRLYSGNQRQMQQMRESTVRVIGADKLGRFPLSEEDE